MSIARYGPTATLLNDGGVLVAGGIWTDAAGNRTTNTAEIYYPASDTWLATGTMTAARYGHTATLLEDGRVLVVGGYTGVYASNSYFKSAEVYSPATNSWTAVPDMRGEEREGHTATRLLDGRVLVVAGGNYWHFTADAEIYNPAANSWSYANDAPSGLNWPGLERYRHTSTLLPDGRVLVAGGLWGNTRLNSVAIFNPVTNGWVSGPYMSVARYLGRAISLANGQVLVTGGEYAGGPVSSSGTAEIFDPTSNSWFLTAPTGTPRNEPFMVLLADESILLAGGGNCCLLDTAEVFGTLKATTLVAAPATAVFGGFATLSATLTASGSPLEGRAVTFAVNGTTVGAAVTDLNGVASLHDVPTTGLSAGTYPSGIAATFAGDAFDGSATGVADLTVALADPTIIWNPEPLIYGTLLGADQLNASASIPGVFAYSPPVGAVLPAGSHTLTLTFTPTDTANYNIVSTQAVVTVQKAEVTVTLTAPPTSTYGRVVRLVADITAQGNGMPPTGLVDFFDNGLLIGTASLSTTTKVSWLVASLSVGSHTLTAEYRGAVNYDGGPSTNVPVAIAAPVAGDVLTWGQNAYGQLGQGWCCGNGYRASRALNSDGTTFTGVVAAAVGGRQSLGIKADGTLWAWGLNVFGELGDGTTTQRLRPVQVRNADGTPFVDVLAVATGDDQSVAVRTDGSVWAWGNNSAGEVGDGTTTQRLNPVRVIDNQDALLSGVVAVSTASFVTLALKADGTVWGWGGNNAGQIGDGSKTRRLQAVQTRLSDGSPLTDVIAISLGYDHALAQTADGTLWAWGYNGQGQLGDGTTTWRLNPVQVISGSAPLTTIASFAAGGSHSLAMKTDGTVWAWGYNFYGQLGVGDQTYRSTATQVKNDDSSPFGDVVAVFGAYSNSFAIKSDRTIWSWGENSYGQLGLGFVSGNRLNPVEVQGNFTTVSNLVTAASQYAHQVVVVQPAVATFSASSMNFGAQTIRTTSPQQSVTLTNTGDGILVFDGVRIVGPNLGDFVLASNTCAQSLAPGGSCSIGVSFVPQSLGSKTATLQIFDNDDHAPHNIPLSGVSVDPSPPVIMPVVSGTLGSNGWYRSNVTVSWSVFDLETQVTTTSGCGTVVVPSDTTGAFLQCTATSGGGSTSQSVTIKRDATAPTLTIRQPASGGLLGFDQLVNADYSCADSISGVSACSGNVASGAPLDTAISGSQSFTLTATDAAGNTSTQTVNYSVLSTPTVAAASVYVPNRETGTVSVVDTVTNRTIATVPVGPNPVNVAVSRDGQRAYVANLNANYVSMIDTTTNANVGSLQVGNGPWGLAVSPDNSRLYVANLFSRRVSAVDVGSGQTVGGIDVAGNARGISLTPDGRYLFVADATVGFVEVIDTAGMTMAAVIPVGYQPQQAAITPDGTRVYVPTLNTIAVIDAGRVPACPAPDTWLPPEPPSPTCPEAILTQLARTAAVPPPGQQVTIVPLPDVPSTIAFSADGARAYITHSTPGGAMSVLDLASHTLGAVIGLNSYPYGIGVAANGPRVYVSRGGAGTLSVLDTTTTTVMTEVTVGLQPALIALTPIPATLRTQSVPGTYAGRVDLSATLMFDGAPVVGRRVSFSMHQIAVGSAVTGSDGTATLHDVALGTITAGNYPDDIVAEFIGDGYYLPSNTTASLTVSPATPVITWPTPAEVIDGTVLNNLQLNASTSVAGTFVYNPPPLTVLRAGTHELKVTFIPSDTVNYTQATASVLQVVAPPLVVTVTGPNGGEKVFDSSPYFIQWTASGGVGGGPATFDLSVSVDGGITLNPIAECTGVRGDLRSCTWIPRGLATSKARIKISARDTVGNGASDESDANFTIDRDAPFITVSNPAAGGSWPVGSSLEIQWAHNLGLSSRVTIQESLDGGWTWNLIAASVVHSKSGSGSYLWKVPNSPTTKAQVRVIWLDGNASGTSGLFSIQAPSITFEAPAQDKNGTTPVWKIGKSKSIRWTHNLPPGIQMVVEVSRDEGDTWAFVHSRQTTAGITKESYNWMVTGPATATDRARIRVRADGYVDPPVISDPFTIN
jgi:YVTN family beta-propeller protein